MLPVLYNLPLLPIQKSTETLTNLLYKTGSNEYDFYVQSIQSHGGIDGIYHPYSWFIQSIAKT